MRESRLDNIQLLRAVAVFCVLISHVAFELKRLLADKVTTFNDKFFPGDFGVDLFFIISGFIMVYTCWDKFADKGASVDFVKRRLVRIVPLYWITTSLMIAIIIAMPDKVHSATSDIWQWITSYLFVPYAREGDGFIRPVLGLGWSLQYEMAFYAVFAIGLFFSRNLGMFIVIGGVIAMYLLANVAGDGTTLARFIGHQIILEFSLGAILGGLYMTGSRLSKRVCVAMAVTGVGLLLLSPNFNEFVDANRLIYYGFPAMLIVSAVVFHESKTTAKVPGSALLIGETSYSIYLTHPFVVGIMAMLVGKLGLLETASAMQIFFIYGVGTVLLSLIVGIAGHYILDAPLTNWIKRKTIPRKNPVAYSGVHYNKMLQGA